MATEDPRYEDGVGNGMEVPIVTKRHLRATATLSERLDRAAAIRFSGEPAAMDLIRKLWREGAIDLAWDTQRNDAAVMPLTERAAHRLATIVVTGEDPGT